jgi:hypothetical protein
VEQAGVLYSAAQWTPQDLESLAHHLRTEGRKSLARVSNETLLNAWCDTVETFRDPRSVERRSLDPSLSRLCQLSIAGLEAGLEAVLGGVSRDSAESLQTQAEESRLESPEGSLVLVALAANLPGLAVQPLLPALLLRLPVILKSPTSEPLFAPAFVRALGHRLPELRAALAAITWKGGDQALEAPLLAAASRLLAYGEAEALADLRERAGGKLFAYGPKTSVAIVAESAAPATVAAGLARDIALFDQRGCLSIQAIFTAGDAAALARITAEELQVLSRTWPPGRLDPVAAAGVQQVRTEAALRGLFVPDMPLAAGTVVIEPEARFQPSPGLRTVRIHPIENLNDLPEILVGWSGQLQGAALAGEAAWRLQPSLAELGISHFAAPGQLQTPDASWHNGGVHPFAVLTGSAIGKD